MKSDRRANMNKKIAIFAFAVVLLFTFSSHANDLTILFTGSTRNVFLACGCPGNPFGGISQRAYMIETFRNQSKDLLLLDGGDIFPAGKSDFEKRKLQYILKAYSLMNYDAIAPGEMDFNLGLKYLMDEVWQTSLPFISASLFSDETRTLLFPPYMIKNINGVKIGVLSLTEGNLESVTADSQTSRIKAYLDYLKSKTDIIIIVSHADLATDKILIEKYPQVSLIIEGHWGKDYPHKTVHKSVPIFNAGKDGEYLGKLKVSLNEKNRIEKIEDEFIPLSKVLPADKKVEKLFLQYLDEVKKTSAEGETIPEYEAYRAGMGNIYMPNEKCAECHSEQFDQWSSTKHAEAFETLIKDGRDFDPECLYCHTTGYGRKGGYVNFTKTPEMINVGCTACHKVTDNHPQSKSSEAEITENVCVVCHTTDKDPNFIFEEFVPKVMH